MLLKINKTHLHKYNDKSNVDSMIVYRVNVWIWDLKPGIIFGSYEYGWKKIKNDTLYSTLEKAYEYIKETYKLDSTHFVWRDKDHMTEEIQFIMNGFDRYKIIISSENINIV